MKRRAASRLFVRSRKSDLAEEQSARSPERHARLRRQRGRKSRAFPKVTHITFGALNPSYGSSTKDRARHAGATVRNRTMTRSTGLSIVIIGAALSMTAGLAFAGDTVSADQILGALRPKPLTRGLSAAPVDTAAQAKEAGFVETLRNRKTRSLSLGERQEIAEIAATKPKIDLEIHFDYNSAEIAKDSMPSVQELGKALSNASLRGSTFVVAG